MKREERCLKKDEENTKAGDGWNKSDGIDQYNIFWMTSPHVM